MGKLKRYWILTFVFLTVFLQSCSDDDGYSIGDIGIDWVTVHVESDGLYTFTGDTWGTMFPAANAIWGYYPVEGQRALLYFNPLYDNYGGYDVGIKPEMIYPILTKSVESLTAENDKEFGDDPAYITDLWISGGYMNLMFKQKAPEKLKHLVSLVKRASEPDIADDGYIHLEYRYNTYGDTLDYVVPGVVSYNLDSLPLNEAKGIKLRVNDAIYGERIITFTQKEEPLPESAKQVIESDVIRIQ